MSLNVREYNNKQLLLFPASIGDYLPDNDLAHVVDEAVDAIDLTPYYNKVADVGNPSYHPSLMIKIWFYGYATKVYSSRKIEDKLHKDVAFIYLAGMQKPDFKAIAEFRRKHLNELKNSFIEMVQICHRLGLTSLGEIAIDSKVMKANASAERAYTDKDLMEERKEIQDRIDKYLENAAMTDTEEDHSYGIDKRGNDLPHDIRKKEERIQKIRQMAERLEQAYNKLKQSSQKKINITDTDAVFQKGKSGIIPGYRAQAAVDSKEQVIIVNDVTPGQNDAAQLVPMVDKTLENIKKLEPDKYPAEDGEQEKINITADGGYSSGSNLFELEKEEYKEKIEPYVPDTNSPIKERGKGYDVTSPFHRSKFIYNKSDNSYACPSGKKLRYMGRHLLHGVPYHIYDCSAGDCKACEYFGVCTSSKKGRRLSMSEYQPLIDEMRYKLSTKEGKRIYATRKVTVEPVFGNMSHNMGFREFLLRGIEKVKGEFSLMCTAHNLLKIAKAVRRSGISLKDMLIKPEYPLLSVNGPSQPEAALVFNTS